MAHISNIRMTLLRKSEVFIFFMSERNDMSTRGLLLQWASTVLVLYKRRHHHHLIESCSRHDIAQKLLKNWTTTTHSLKQLFP